MTKNKLLFVISIVIIAALLLVAASCIKIVPKTPPGSRPGAPTSPPAQPVSPSQPGEPSSSPPPAPAAADRPDLTVTDVWVISKEVYYKAKNMGTAESKGSRAYLFVNGIKQAEDYTEPLAPGQERAGPFSNYAWKFQELDVPDIATGVGVLEEDRPVRFTIKVCADVENTLVESDESNNCKTIIMGIKYSYRFADFAHQALWTTGYGTLKLPLPEESATGAAMVANVSLEDNQGGATILMIPQQVNDGWIQGRFGQFYSDELRQTRVRDITIPDIARFSARVGFTSASAPGSKARFMFGTVDPSGIVTFANPPVTASMDGKMDTYEVDLSNLAGQKRQFVLRVEVIGPPQNVRPVWVDPRVYQP